MGFPKHKKGALAESGGGAKGAYQIGVGEMLAKHGFDPKIYAGTSVGALNATMGAQVGLVKRGREFWYKQKGNTRTWLRKKDIFKEFGKLKSGRRLLRDGGIMSNRPLHKWIDRTVDPKAIKKRGVVLEVGAVNLHTLRYHTFSPGDPNFNLGLLASINAPLAVPPEEIKVPPATKKQLWADGGIQNLTPIGDALKHNPDFLVIVILRKLGKPKAVKVMPRLGGFKGLGVLKRTVDAMFEEIAFEDVQQFERLNEAARLYEKDAGKPLVINGKRIRFVPYILIQPSKDLGDGEDFDSATLESRYQLGLKDAKKALKKAGFLP